MLIVSSLDFDSNIKEANSEHLQRASFPTFKKLRNEDKEKEENEEKHLE